MKKPRNPEDKGRFLQRWWRWIKSTWQDPIKLARDTRALVAALRLVRAAINSPGAEELVKLIPGQVDDAILVALKSALDKVLGVVDAWNKIPKLFPKNEALQNAVLHKAGSIALVDMHKVAEAQADHMIQLEYMHQKFSGPPGNKD